MKVKLNYNNDKLYCIYSKELIEIGEKYIEVVEDYLGEKIIKTYAYEYLDELVDEYLELYDKDPDIFGDDE